MTYLNLADFNKTEIPFKVSKFPDGQQSVKIETTSEEVTIKSRLNNFRDLELIICTNQALREMGTQKVNLFVPYFLGARSDRKFQEGTSNYLKTVICPIINSQRFDSVTVIDPHSDVLEACLENFNKLTNFSLVKFALEDIQKDDSDVTIVSPDAGALKKIYDVMEHFDLEKLIVASKHRDIKTGKITHTEVPGLDTEPGRRNYVIIDDICDGGRTFIEIAKAIRQVRHKSIFHDRIYLIVTHGIFSAGFSDLSEYFETIYCTNSIEDIQSNGTSIVYSRGAQVTSKDLLKQLNVF